MSNAYGWRGCWINVLQDFNFKILHQPKSKHFNVDTFNHNLIGNVNMMNTSLKKSKTSYCCKKLTYKHGLGEEACAKLPNLFMMVEPIVNCDAISQEDPTNFQNEIHKSEVAYRSPILKKIKKPTMDKGTCWELVEA